MPLCSRLFRVALLALLLSLAPGVLAEPISFDTSVTLVYPTEELVVLVNAQNPGNTELEIFHWYLFLDVGGLLYFAPRYTWQPIPFAIHFSLPPGLDIRGIEIDRIPVGFVPSDIPVTWYSICTDRNGSILGKANRWEVTLKTLDIGPTTWTRLLGGQKNETARALALSRDDFIYITGETDSTPLDGLSGNGIDQFLAKYDQDGNRLWTRRLGDTGGDFRSSSDLGYGVTVDARGSVYMTGTTNAERFFDGNVTTDGSFDVTLAKYDSSGNWLWSQAYGGVGMDQGRDVDIDAQGNIYLSGFTETPRYSPSLITKTVDFFLTKCDRNGSVLWTRNPGGSASDEATAAALDSAGNIYLVGNTASDNFIGYTTVPGVDQAVLMKYDPNGAELWTRFISSEAASVHDVCLDNNGTILVTGDLLEGGSSNLFVAKYDAAGNQLWLAEFDTLNASRARGIAVDSQGEIAVTGSVSADAPNSDSETLLVKLDGSGRLLWSKRIRAKGSDSCFGIGIGSDDSIYIAGGTNSPVFDTYDTAGGEDALVMKYTSIGFHTP